MKEDGDRHQIRGDQHQRKRGNQFIGMIEGRELDRRRRRREPTGHRHTELARPGTPPILTALHECLQLCSSTFPFRTRLNSTIAKVSRAQ